MHWIFAAVRFFPYWALPVALVCFETGVYFMRRRRKRSHWMCWALSMLLIVMIGSWFVFRGDIHSDSWVQSAFSLNQ